MVFKIELASERQEADVTCGMPNNEPVRRSIVQVQFPTSMNPLAYYNDRFDLKRGDLVYVDGKFEGVAGRVTSVSYNFKIKLSDYQRVIALVDTSVKGQFHVVNRHFLSFDRESIPYQKVISWFKAPSEEDEYTISHDDSSFSLENLNDFNVSSVIAGRGETYYKECWVKYISLDGAKGFAIVECSKPYEVEFEYRDGKVSKLTCTCLCNYNCKHMYATMMQLRETIEMIEKHYACEYARTGYFAAITKEMFVKLAVEGIETGSFVI